MLAAVALAGADGGADDERHLDLGAGHVVPLAGLVAIWSEAMSAKSMYISSTTGRRPTIAAPTAVPQMQASEIGVLKTRSRPNASSRSLVSLKAPP
jgi:hypothetical protein